MSRSNGKLFRALVIAMVALLGTATPSLSEREEIGHGSVQLGACNGATAAYVQITPAEDREAFGLGAGEYAASLNNSGKGEAGAVFFPDYSGLTPDQKSAVEFGAAEIFFKGDADAPRHLHVTICFGSRPITLPLSQFKISDEGLGWRRARFGPRQLGLRDDQAGRLDKMTVSLSEQEHVLVGNVVTIYEVPRRGRDALFGQIFFSNLDTNLSDCSILNNCK